jgi:bifunctional ADP-heptose synthase (sugar kinase/adenylyltransferase)
MVGVGGVCRGRQGERVLGVYLFHCSRERQSRQHVVGAADSVHATLPFFLYTGYTRDEGAHYAPRPSLSFFPCLVLLEC